MVVCEVFFPPSFRLLPLRTLLSLPQVARFTVVTLPPMTPATCPHQSLLYPSVQSCSGFVTTTCAE